MGQINAGDETNDLLTREALAWSSKLRQPQASNSNKCSPTTRLDLSSMKRRKLDSDTLRIDCPEITVDFDSIEYSRSLEDTLKEKTQNKDISPTVLDAEEVIKDLQAALNQKDREIERLKSRENQLLEEREAEIAIEVQKQVQKATEKLHTAYSEQATNKIQEAVHKIQAEAYQEKEEWHFHALESDRVLKELLKACDAYLTERGF